MLIIIFVLLSLFQQCLCMCGQLEPKNALIGGSQQPSNGALGGSGGRPVQFPNEDLRGSGGRPVQFPIEDLRGSGGRPVQFPNEDLRGSGGRPVQFQNEDLGGSGGQPVRFSNEDLGRFGGHESQSVSHIPEELAELSSRGKRETVYSRNGNSRVQPTIVEQTSAFGDKCLARVTCNTGADFNNIYYAESTGLEPSHLLKGNVQKGEKVEINSNGGTLWTTNDGEQSHRIAKLECRAVEKPGGINVEDETEAYVRPEIIIFERSPKNEFVKVFGCKSVDTLVAVVASNTDKTTVKDMDTNMVVGQGTESWGTSYLPVTFNAKTRKWMAFDAKKNTTVEVKTIGCRKRY